MKLLKFACVELTYKSEVIIYHCKNWIYFRCQEENKAATTDIAIETKDWGQLVDIVLRGEADLLVGKTSEDNEVQEFINNAQTFKTKVNKIHEGKFFLIVCLELDKTFWQT